MVARQLDIGGLDDESAEIDAGYVWRELLWGAMRQFVAGYVANGQRGYDACAAALDLRWGPKGRPVSASQLRAALTDSERNNFRAEWLDWFAARDSDIANIIAHRVKPVKTPEEYVRDLEAEVHETYPKHAASVIRRARAR